MKGHHARLIVAGGTIAAAGTTTYEHLNLFTEIWTKVPVGWQNLVCFAAGGLILPLLPKLLRGAAGGLDRMYQELLGEAKRKNPPRGTTPGS